MKIAIFSPYNIFMHGGVQEHVQNQIRILRARGHDVTLLTPRPAKTSKYATPPEGVVFLGVSRRIKSPHATSGDVSASIDNDAIDAALAANYDIIHVHEPLVPIVARQVLARAEGISVRIGTFHAALPGNTLGRSLVSTYKAYARGVLPHVDIVTAVSPAAVGFIEEYTTAPITFIPNGINTESFSPKPVVRDQNMILFIGRLEKRKGALLVIKAFMELQKTNPDVRLKIAGDGPLRKSLESYVEDAAITGIEFLGFIDEDTKLDLLSRCAVYTSPALYGESFGIVLAEAMAMSTPIVCHKNDGYSWVMKDTGRLSLVDCRDSRAYAERLQLMMEDDSLRTAWQKWAALYVVQFDYEKIVDSYEAVYAAALAARDTP